MKSFKVGDLVGPDKVVPAKDFRAGYYYYQLKYLQYIGEYYNIVMLLGELATCLTECPIIMDSIDTIIGSLALSINPVHH